MDRLVRIRTKGELIDFLDGRKKWRKHELISFVNELKTGRPREVPRIGRASLVLAYAHWEGFVKDAALAYLHLVVQKHRNLSELKPCFQALACRQELLGAQSAKRRIAPHVELVERLTDRLNDSCYIDPASAIDTESNLTSGVLENICTSVGISYSKEWSTDGPFIDDLYRNRCAVAHGEVYEPDRDYILEVLDFTIKAIDRFSTAIENEAVQDLYLRPPGQSQQAAPAI